MTPDPRLTRTLTDALAAEDIHLARADIDYLAAELDAYDTTDPDALMLAVERELVICDVQVDLLVAERIANRIRRTR